MFTKIIIGVALVILIKKILVWIKLYFEYLRYKSEGVVFINNSFRPISDMALLSTCAKKFPFCAVYTNYFPQGLKSDILPPVVGRIFAFQMNVVFTKVEALSDLYVNKNSSFTKHK